MRKIVYLFLGILFFSSCSEDDHNNLNSNATQEVSFGIVKKNQSNNTNGDVLTPTKIVLTLKDTTADTIIYNKKVLDLFDFNGQYLTQNVTLTVGEYAVEDYFVTDADNQVIYASPKEGSELAQYVNDPLPLNFSVTPDEITQVLPEVLLVNEDYTPEQFGYASFGFNVVDNLKENQIRIEQGGTITTPEGNTLTLPAKVIVDQDGNTISSGIMDVAFTSTNEKRMLSKDFPEIIPYSLHGSIDPNTVMDDYYYYNAFSVAFFKDGVEVYINENAHFDITLEGNGSLYPTLDIVSVHKENTINIQVNAQATPNNTIYKASLNTTGNFYLARRVDMAYDPNNSWTAFPDTESDLEVLFANEKIKQDFVTFLNTNLYTNLSVNDIFTQGHLASIIRNYSLLNYVSPLTLNLSSEQNTDYEGIQYLLELQYKSAVLMLEYNNGGITDDDYFLNYIKNITFNEWSDYATYFNLSNNNLSQIVSLPSLGHALDMSYNNIQSIPNEISYSRLNLSHNQISGDLSKITIHKSQMKPQGYLLDLSYNNISLDDLKTLNTRADELNFSHNQITGKLPSNIYFSYTHSASMYRYFNFSHNQITDISVLKTQNLNYNSSISNRITFDFSYNQITDITPLEGIELPYYSDSSPSHFVNINLTGNPLTEEQVQSLREVLPFAEITF